MSRAVRTMKACPADRACGVPAGPREDVVHPEQLQPKVGVRTAGPELAVLAAATSLGPAPARSAHPQSQLTWFISCGAVKSRRRPTRSGRSGKTLPV